jgi:NAD(P)-dependent dehydrogenase (short-subunit alcohol dehydrogenase family)
MKILIIDEKGSIGKIVGDHFDKENEVVRAERKSGSVIIDIDDSESIKKGLDQIGKVDAIICMAGEVRRASFNSLNENDFNIGIMSKLMGQVNLVRIGQNYLNANGSITLTTGILSDDTIAKTASEAIVNGGIHSFVKAVALELSKNIRINVVSLGVVENAYENSKNDLIEYNPVPMKKVLSAFIRSVIGDGNGEVIKIYTKIKS